VTMLGWGLGQPDLPHCSLIRQKVPQASGLP
jgi:hypothetical protein